MNNVQSKIAMGVVSLAVVLLVIGVVRALSPKAHYMPAGPAGQAASAAYAGGPMTAEQLMQYMDTDGDGYITMAEAPEELKSGFDFIDRNGDGGIDVQEAQVMADYNNNPQSQSAQSAAAGPVTAEQMMTYMDTNGDGYITMDEAPEELKTGFDFIDTNGDGGIDVKEAQVMADYNNSGQP